MELEIQEVMSWRTWLLGPNSSEEQQEILITED